MAEHGIVHKSPSEMEERVGPTLREDLRNVVLSFWMGWGRMGDKKVIDIHKKRRNEHSTDNRVHLLLM